MKHDLDYIVENWGGLPITYKLELVLLILIAKYRTYIRLGTAVMFGGLLVYLFDMSVYLAVELVATILMLVVFYFTLSIVDNIHTW
jgi:hypothetical protein